MRAKLPGILDGGAQRPQCLRFSPGPGFRQAHEPIGEFQEGGEDIRMQVRPAMQLFDGFGDEMAMAGEIKVRQGIFCHHGAPRLVVAGPAKCQVTYYLTVLKAFCRDADRESLLFAYSLPEIPPTFESMCSVVYP